MRLLQLLLASALAFAMAEPWSPRGGARYFTSHSMHRPIDEAETTFEEDDIKVRCRGLSDECAGLLQCQWSLFGGGIVGVVLAATRLICFLSFR